MADTSLIAKIILRLQDEASQGLNNAKQRVGGIGEEVNRVKQLMLGLFSFVAIKEGIQNLVGLSDTYANLTARVKLATSSEQEFNTAQGELFNIAQRSRTALDAVVGLYAKVQIGVKALGGTQKQSFDTTEAVTQAFKISGATAAESAGGIQQFTQAIASGVFRGEEFNSVMEQGPRLAQALADGLGVPISALRGMAEAGELTSERVINALLSQKDKLAAEYATFPNNVSGAWQKLENQFLKYIGDSKNVSEANQDIAKSIGYVTDHLDDLITLGVRAGEVLLVAFGANKLKALITYTEGMLAAKKAAAEVTAATGGAAEAATLFSRALGLVDKALGGFIAWDVGQEIGKWALQFEWVQQASANAGEKIAKIVALAKALSDPFSTKSWQDFDAEIQRIEAHFNGVRENIGKVDTAPAPTIFERLKASANSMAEGIDAALTKTKDAAKSKAEEMVKPYDDAAKAIVASFDAQSAQIDANLKNRLYVIDYLATSEKQKIEATTKAVLDAEFEKTTAALNTKIQLDQTWSETYGKAIELARKAGGDISELEKQGAEARINSLQSVVTAYQSSVDNMINEEKRLLDAVRHTAEERENLSRSVEDKVRALLQKGMSDVQAYADQQRQIDEKQAAAKKAILEGNFTDAKRFAEESIRLAESTAHAVDNVSKDSQGKTQRKEAISENQAIAKSIEQIKESAALADSALAGLGNAQMAQAQNVAKSLEGAKSGLAEFKGELDKAITDANNKAQLKIHVDAAAAQAEIAKLEALTAAKELTAKIKLDPLNADQEIADLQAKLKDANVKVPAVLAFDKMRDKELAKIQEELRKSIAFLTAVPVGVDTSDAVAKLEAMKADIEAKLETPTEAAHTVNPDFEAVFRAINEIKRDTFSHHTIYVHKVGNNATGGLIQHLATGGSVVGQTFRRVVGAIKGPGTGTSDDVPVMASNGEFVVKTEAVQHYGVNFMNALNNKQLPVAPGYAIGGAIGDVGAAGGSPAVQSGETINLNFNFGPKTVTLQGSRSAARELAVELRSLARVS